MLSTKCVQLTSRVPQVVSVVVRGYATPAAVGKSSGSAKPVGKLSSLPLKPSILAAPKPPKRPVPDAMYDDDFTIDPIPVTLSSTPVQPISPPIQPFANKKTPPPISKVLAASSPAANFSSPLAPPTPIAIPTPAPTLATTPVTSTIPTPLPPAPTLTPPASKRPPANKSHAKKAPAPSLANIPKAPAVPSPGANKAAISRELQGRTPAQLLNQITQLQQHNATLQSQLVYHSAVEAIYGESGFNQLRNLISEFTEEESNILKAAGFESEHVIHNLETRQRDLCLQFTQAMGADLAKHIGVYVKKLKDQHRQSASAATATQQTLRNAGVPDSVISSTLVGLQPHLDELQARIVRWEKLKADVDLLIATHSGNH